MDLRQHLINFDNYKVRASGGGSIMTEPREKSPKVQIEELEAQKPVVIASYRKKIEDAEAKRDGITNKATKGYTAAEERINKLNQEFETKLIEINQSIRDLQPRANDIFLSKTCKSYLIKVYIQEKYGRRDDLTNRYVKKGNQAEDNSIAILNEVDDVYPFYEKNTIRMFDDFKQGECDIYHDEKKILDAKSSWDLFTFMPKTAEELNSDYWWQGQIYMDLWDVDEYEVCYILTDTPDGIIADEQKRLLYAMGTNKKDTQAYAEGCKELEYNLKYSDIPIQERVFKVKVKRDREAIARLHERIKECRIWLNQYSIERFIQAYGIEEYKKLIPEEVKPVEVEFEPEVNVPVEPETGKTLKESLTEAFNEVLKDSEVISSIDINIPKVDIILKEGVKSIEVEITNLVETSSVTTDIPVISEIPEPIQEPDFDLIYSTIDKITSVAELRQFYSEIEDVINENEDIRQAFSNKEIEINSVIKEKVIITSITENNGNVVIDAVSIKPIDNISVDVNVEPSEPRVVEANDSFEPDSPHYIAKKRIEACTTLEEVIELRKEIKSMFDEFPDLSDIITQKRDSLKPKEEVKSEPEKPVKRVVIPATPEPKVIQVDLEDSIKEVKAEAAANPDDELIKSLYASVREMKTKEEIQTLYRANQAVIDKNLPLRRFMETSIDKLKQIPQ